MAEAAIVVTAALAVEERWRSKKREAEAEQAARMAIEPSMKLAEHYVKQAEEWARQAKQAAKQKPLGKDVKEKKAARSDSRDV